MSDLGKGALDAPAIPVTIEQTYALRGRLTALLTQTVQAETKIRYRIADLETEAGRLKAHLEQTTAAIEALRRSIQRVDEAIGRRIRELRASAAVRAEAEAETRVENPEPAPRAHQRESRRRPQ
jgi:chromosome segregation ATPase